MKARSAQRTTTRPRGGFGTASLVALCLGILSACVPPALGAWQQPDPPMSEPSGPMGRSDLARLLSSATDETVRKAEAREVLRQFSADPSLRVPAEWLSQEPAAALRLLAASTETQGETEALAGAIVRALRTGENGETTWAFQSLSPDARTACLSVLSRSFEPGAGEALVAWLESSPAEQRRAILQALVNMTGREDLGASPASWRQWLSRHQHLPPLAWRTLLAEGVQRRAERLGQRERDLLARLGDSTRRLYAALPPAERPAVLAGLLADAEPVIRLTATDLLSRDLERGISPGPEVAVALIKLLEDPQANIRQAAAVLVDRIVPEGSAARLTVALRKEAEPEVAAVMLRAFRRYPDAAAIDAVLRWLEFGEPTRSGAMRAVMSLLESGFEPSADQRDRILAVIDSVPVARRTPADVQVLAHIGGQRGLDEVRQMLFASQADIRRAAADALLMRADAIDDLLAAAEADPALLQRAADAVAMHKPWAPLLRRVALIELRAPTSAAGPEMLPVTATLARFLPAHERLSAAQELSRRPFAVAAILGRPSREMFEPGPAGDRAYAQARSLLGLPEKVEQAQSPTPSPEPARGQDKPPQEPGQDGPTPDPQPDPQPTDPQPTDPQPTDPGGG